MVSDPEILDRDSKVAADVVALYFRDMLNNPTIKRKYGNKDHNDFSNLENATKAVSNANAGPATNIDKGIPREGTQKALAFARNLDLDNLIKAKKHKIFYPFYFYLWKSFCNFG